MREKFKQTCSLEFYWELSQSDITGDFFQKWSCWLPLVSTLLRFVLQHQLKKIESPHQSAPCIELCAVICQPWMSQKVVGKAVGQKLRMQECPKGVDW